MHLKIAAQRLRPCRIRGEKIARICQREKVAAKRRPRDFFWRLVSPAEDALLDEGADAFQLSQRTPFGEKIAGVFRP
jgi:hypothetical protein